MNSTELEVSAGLQRPVVQMRRFSAIHLLIAIPVLLFAAVLAFTIFRPIQVLPRITLAPGYGLVDQDGNRLTNEDMRGKLVLYTITYIGCGENCPQTSGTMQAIQDAVATVDTGGLPVEYVTISFDPARDTPAQLRQYADDIGADTSIWHFVTGDETMLKQIIGAGFSTYYAPNGDGTFTFDPAFFLVDGWGILRAEYRTDTPDLAIVQRDVGLIAKEALNRDGVNRYAYEAAHLFLCYPR